MICRSSLLGSLRLDPSGPLLRRTPPGCERRVEVKARNKWKGQMAKGHQPSPYNPSRHHNGIHYSILNPSRQCLVDPIPNWTCLKYVHSSTHQSISWMHRGMIDTWLDRSTTTCPESPRLVLRSRLLLDRLSPGQWSVTMPSISLLFIEYKMFTPGKYIWPS